MEFQYRSVNVDSHHSKAIRNKKKKEHSYVPLDRAMADIVFRIPSLLRAELELNSWVRT